MFELNREDIICLLWGAGSSCELSRDPTPKIWLDILEARGIKCEYPIFFFNRIKATPERKGIGTQMMNQLVKILDQRRIAVINTMNAYGRMNEKDLRKWFHKWGFIDVIDNLIYRPPKENDEDKI